MRGGAWVAVVCLVGCIGETSPLGSADASLPQKLDAGPIDAGASELELRAERWAAAYCDFRARCLGRERAVLELTEAECRSMQHGFFLSRLVPIEAALEVGRTSFDDARFELCLTALGGSDCDLIDPWQAGCYELFSGSAEAGDACYNDEECGRGLFCVREDSNYCGACLPKGRGGERCNGNYSCAEGFQCNARGICLEMRELGETCGQTELCIGTLICPARVADPNPTCLRPRREGEMCSAFRGETCDTRNNLSCVEGVCVARVWSKLGEGCGDNRACGGFTFCEDGVCRSYPGPGESCASPLARCADSYCGEEQICIAQGIENDPCDPEKLTCSHPLTCLGDIDPRCTAPRLCE